MDAYPSYRFRGDKANPEEILVLSAEHEAEVGSAEDGWRHSPDPEAPPSEDPELVQARHQTTTPDGVLHHYPSYRYRKGPEGEIQEALVQDPTHEAEVAPAAMGWVDTPAALEEDYVPPPQSEGPNPNASQPVIDAASEAAFIAELATTKQSDVIAAVLQIADDKLLMRIHERETQGKNRKTILNAINARMNELLEATKG